MARADLEFCFVVATEDPMVLQETHETLYHILWELVHVFFEHEGLLT
jgi:D-sedoheptulose 7-phosphate isomerase